MLLLCRMEQKQQLRWSRSWPSYTQLLWCIFLTLLFLNLWRSMPCVFIIHNRPEYLSLKDRKWYYISLFIIKLKLGFGYDPIIYYFFTISAKQGIPTLRLKTIEVVYVLFFEPAQLASVCKSQQRLWPRKDEDEDADAKPSFWLQPDLDLAKSNHCPSDSDSDSIIIMGTLSYFCWLFCSSNQIAYWELKLAES